MLIHAFRFIDERAFNESMAEADRTSFHNANQLWAFAISIRCATACPGAKDAVEIAWRVFEYHLRVDAQHFGVFSFLIKTWAFLHYDRDYTIFLRDARRLFRIALDKVVPEKDWLKKFNFFDMTPFQARWYALTEYRLTGLQIEL